MNEDAFHRVLLDDPGDELTWSALADWLEDDGQTPRAELLRLTRRMLPTPVSQRGEMPRRYSELLAAGARPVIVRGVNPIGMRFALVPAGRFLMGSPPDEQGRNKDEQLHEVEITRPFWLGACPVTQGQWRAVRGNTPSYFSKSGGGKNLVKNVSDSDLDLFPVERVSWEDAQDFLKKLNALAAGKKGGVKYRLPTEAEWEYSCRGGAGVQYPFVLARPGASLCSTQANFDGRHPYGGARQGPHLERPCKVGSYESNPFGLYDVHGNVWEWCADWYAEDYYAKSPPKNPSGPDGGSRRVIRGGCWYKPGRDCRAAYRIKYSPSDRGDLLGFRVAAVPHE
jgi:uncharacterized protein (TIGR02996 family)